MSLTKCLLLLWYKDPHLFRCVFIYIWFGFFKIQMWSRFFKCSRCPCSASYIWQQMMATIEPSKILLVLELLTVKQNWVKKKKKNFLMYILSGLFLVSWLFPFCTVVGVSLKMSKPFWNHKILLLETLKTKFYQGPFLYVLFRNTHGLFFLKDVWGGVAAWRCWLAQTCYVRIAYDIT